MQLLRGTAVRIVLGLCIFTLLAGVDLRRHGAAARRWREYAVLLTAVCVAMLYGIVNDQITSSISWEYFYYGKALENVLGPKTPPDTIGLHLAAAKIGIEATWGAGLIFGVILLLANNPFHGIPRLANRELARRLPLIVAVAAGCGAVFGLAGWLGWLNGASVDFTEMARTGLFRPRHFTCAWGFHLGGYIGGFLGTILAAISVIRARRRRRNPLGRPVQSS
jgi:hypothetical protein